jgi:hypothetical protein
MTEVQKEVKVDDSKELSDPVNKGEKKLLVPDSNVLQVSSKKGFRFYIFLSKIFLKTYEEIELHALGQATGMCARLGESLQREELGEITSIKTSTFIPKQSVNRPRRGKKIKLIVKIHRSDKFSELCEDDLKVANEEN